MDLLCKMLRNSNYDIHWNSSYQYGHAIEMFGRVIYFIITSYCESPSRKRNLHKTLGFWGFCISLSPNRSPNITGLLTFRLHPTLRVTHSRCPATKANWALGGPAGWSGKVGDIEQGSLYYQPKKNSLFFGEILQIYHPFALFFISPKMGNWIIPVDIFTILFWVN